MSWPIDPRFNIFNDPPAMEVGRRCAKNGVIARQPMEAEVSVVEGGRGDYRERPAPSYAEVRYYQLLLSCGNKSKLISWRSVA